MQPPAENLCGAAKRDLRRDWRGRVRRERPDGGLFVDAAERRPKHVIQALVVDERMNEADDWEARPRSVTDRGPATIRVPAEDLAGEVQAAQSIRACDKLYATRWHLDYVSAASRVEHVRPPEKAREGLAVLAIADEAEAGGRRNLAGNAAYAAAPAAKGKVHGHACRANAGDHELALTRSLSSLSWGSRGALVRLKVSMRPRRLASVLHSSCGRGACP